MDNGEELALLPGKNDEARIGTRCGCCSQICFYGLGHIFNDLCAAVWFSYTLFYFQIVLEMESTTAGTLIMLGTVAVAVGFSMIFSSNPGLENWWSLLYYSSFVTLFQIGWAIVQISHLSVIPSISSDHKQSANLTAIRYSASVCCNIFVYIITWAILENGDISTDIGPQDFYKFRELVFIITALGLCTSGVFYCGISEDKAKDEIVETIENGITGKHFLRSFVIYLVSLMYMSSRLYTILNLIYVPLYLEERYVNSGDKSQGIRSAIAIVPLASFSASLFASILLKYRPKGCNDKITYFMGSLFCLLGSSWIALGIPLGSYYQIYIVVCCAGIGGSATMVSSLCLTAQFVKTNGFQGASVYSTVTFTDKLISGAVVLLIQHLQCTPKTECPDFYEHVLAYACGSAAILGFTSLGFLLFKHIKLSSIK